VKVVGHDTLSSKANGKCRGSGLPAFGHDAYFVTLCTHKRICIFGMTLVMPSG
jgi:hypothetical protein